ncbi:type II secretion system minor pseudopilin GspI [Saccharospirillum salsuginis]|uniref:Type II secretion system protein I n=1 Tax=Saccharospirillum salsuginis TaxID=418750 RepID=A0A918N9V3_9GAMM|nr:type II secretion system minor pseudopilin GspI [Saccharospirillum salsuginis]GGX52014.1 hypothetical protein GCM10007392_19170 [Saccharospirillum salsuginis]
MSRTESGFTLIEVMIAVAIFAVMAGAIAMANSQNLTAAYQIEQQTQGRWVNENVLARMRLSAAPDLGSKTEKVEFNGQTWTVEIEVTEFSPFEKVAQENPAVQSVKQQIGQRTRSVELRAFPPESDTHADALYAILGDP